ncbi:MAG: TolC family protein, partial [Chloroflexi bacterium]|nr:TolC family protein [Chloroflexota bacterium]
MFTLLLIAGSVEAGDNAQEGRIPPTDLEDQNIGTAQPLMPDFGFLTGQPRLLALREVGTMATDRNPRIDMTRAGIDEAQAGRFIATSSLLPTVAPFSRLGRTDGRIQGSFGNLRNVDFNSVQVGAVLRYELNPAATAFRMKSAGHRLDAAEAYDSETTINVFAQATHQYLDLQYAAARLAITRELVHNARDLVDFSKAREYRGIGLGEDVYRADAELAAAERRLRDAQRQYIAVMLALSETL